MRVRPTIATGAAAGTIPLVGATSTRAFARDPSGTLYVAGTDSTHNDLQLYSVDASGGRVGQRPNGLRRTNTQFGQQSINWLDVFNRAPIRIIEHAKGEALVIGKSGHKLLETSEPATRIFNQCSSRRVKYAKL